MNGFKISQQKSEEIIKINNYLHTITNVLLKNTGVQQHQSDNSAMENTKYFNWLLWLLGNF